MRRVSGEFPVQSLVRRARLVSRRGSRFRNPVRRREKGSWRGHYFRKSGWECSERRSDASRGTIENLPEGGGGANDDSVPSANSRLIWCSQSGSDLVPILCTRCMLFLFLVCFSCFSLFSFFFFVLCALRLVIYFSFHFMVGSFFPPRPTMLYSTLFCLFCLFCFPCSYHNEALGTGKSKTDLLAEFSGCSPFSIVASSAIRFSLFDEHRNHSPPHARVDPHAREARVRGLRIWHHLLRQSPKCQ